MVNTILAPDGKALAEENGAVPGVHHVPVGFSDRFALGFTKLLRFTADTFFAKRYGHRPGDGGGGSRNGRRYVYAPLLPTPDEG